MTVEPKRIECKGLTWTLRCPCEGDAAELSRLRVQMDAETENMDREAGEGVLSPEDFEGRIEADTQADKSLFLVAEADGSIVGYARCAGNTLSRFRHKADFGICIAQKYWGHGVGRVLMEHILTWADSAGITKISLSVLGTNAKAIRIYERFGFVQEGVLVNDRRHRDGNYYDTVLMGRFRG